MRSFRRLLLTLGMLLLAHPVSAQIPTLDAETAELLPRMIAASRQMLNPAAIALESREALGLTAEQVTRLTPIAERTAAAVDSAMARQTAGGPDSPLLQALSDPSGPLDEEAIRREACARGIAQAEMTIVQARGFREMAQVLTDAQQQQMTTLQLRAAMRMMQGVAQAGERQ